MNLQIDSACVIARLGGLPCNVIANLSGRLEKDLDGLGTLDAALQSAREDLVASLFSAVHDAPPEKRRALLTVKRDVYNHRPLRPYRETALWPLVESATGSMAERVLELEEVIHSSRSEFALAYERELNRQYLYLTSLLDDPFFRCGLTVASPLVCREARRLREKTPECYGRREKRLALTLLRYISRAALKLSPFSTFTPVCLARIDDHSPVLDLEVGQWRYRSLVRVRRHVLDRCVDLLFRYSSWRDSLSVEINNSIVLRDDGRVLFRRPGTYEMNVSEHKLHYHEESLVSVRLNRSFLDCLLLIFAGGSISYRDLPSLVNSKSGGDLCGDAIIRHIDHLIEIGLLCFIAPWGEDHGHLEKALITELRQLPGNSLLDNFISRLERLVALECSLLFSDDPLADVSEMDRLVDELLQGAAEHARPSAVPQVGSNSSERNFFQDVWCAPDREENAATVHLKRSGLEQALRSVDPLVRYSQLFDPRQDFLYTFGSFLQQREGEHCRVPLIEAFQNAQPLWQDYMKFAVSTREARDPGSMTWNPLDLPILGKLAIFRRSIHTNLESCFRDESDCRRIVPDEFASLLASIPTCFIDGYAKACLFLQPASADGSLWMLNRLKEGTGRFASRYTPVMPEALRERYTKEIIQQGIVEMDGESVELLDVTSVQGNTLNVHLPQTPKMLRLPGTSRAVPSERQCSLSDLVVTLGRDFCPQVRDHRGQRYLPVHLGVGYYDYIPTLLKFLCAFGPTELGAVFPPPMKHQVDGVLVHERTLIGNVVLQRKSWQVGVTELRDILTSQTEVESFISVRKLLRTYGIPDKAFVNERVSHPVRNSRYQPQYLDLTSPLYLGILRSLTMSGDRFLKFVEVLPSSDAFPVDAEGRAWAIELLLDSISFRSNLESRSSDASSQLKPFVHVESSLSSAEAMT